jgi:N-acetylglucosaminyldiphosphoundecaprenol N-acetyl-beta-D-mannosaminyltransferase
MKELRILSDTAHGAHMDSYRLLGVDVTAWYFDEAVEELLSRVQDRRAVGVHFITAHTLVEADADPSLKQALNDSEFVSPDGMPLVWVGKLRGRRVQRVYGPDTMLAVCDRGRAQGARHFFYGGAEGVPELLAERLTARFPGLEVAGTYSPPFRELTAEEDAEVVAMIDAADADFVWVGLGSPKQDRWVAEHRGRIRAGALMAVGAAFDFHSGRVREAPRWVRQSGFQWLHRLLSEPRRLAKRYTAYNARFLWLLTRDAATGLRRALSRR